MKNTTNEMSNLNNGTTMRRAKLSDMIKYAFGSSGSSLNFMAIMVYLTFFYTDIMGISPAVIGILMMVARLFDAVTDPLMGMIADRTRSKLGSYRPYIMAGAPFLGVITALLFYAPNLSPTMKVVYASITYMLNSLFSTICNVPFHSLATLLTDDSDQRTTVQAFKNVLGIPGQILVTVFALPIVNSFADVKTGWMVFGIICGVVVTLTFWISAWGTKKIDNGERQGETENKVTFKEQLKLIYANRPLLMLLIAFGTDQLALAVANSVNMYYFIYYLNRADLIPTVSMLTIVVNIICLIIVPGMSKKFGKKSMYITFTVLSMIPYTLLFFMKPTSVTAIIALLLISTATAYVPGVLGWSMLADCAVYGEWKFGIFGAGTVTASFTFTNKCGQALGAALTGILLGVAGYVAGQAQTVEALTMIRFMRFIFPTLGYVCSILSMLFYCINNKFYNNMMKELKERKEK